MRALTAPEKALVRSGKQSSSLKLAVSNPAVVFRCRVNQVFSSKDRIAEFIYDGAVGNFGDVIPFMTAYVGTSEGAFDKGIIRVRKALTSTKFYLGETSEIDWADDLYVTVVEDFNIWSRLITISGDNTVRMDYDLDFSDEYGAYSPPVPIIGPLAFVVRLVEGVATLEPDASDSYTTKPNVTIDGYTWTAEGASSTADMDTATPIIEYDAIGEYLLSCEIEDSQGVISTAYRKVFVEPSSPQVMLVRDPEASVDSGGWSFGVQATGDITPEGLHDKTLVVLWADKELYGDDVASIGAVAGQEHVVAIGWINGKSIQWNADFSVAEFEVEGPHYWLSQIYNKVSGLIDISSELSINWVEIPLLTIDKMLSHLYTMRSTAAYVMDCFITGDDKRLSLLNLPGGSIWSQIRAAVENTMMILPLTNLYGQLFVEKPIPLIPEENRDFPVVIELVAGDLLEEVDIEVATKPVSYFVEISGIADYNGTAALPVFSRAPGDVQKHYGEIEFSRGNLLFEDQDDCNEQAALLLSWMNSQYPSVQLPLSMNLRMVDICPRSFLALTVDEDDTPLGIIWEEQPFIVKSVTRRWNADRNYFTTEVNVEISPPLVENSVTYIPPMPPMQNYGLAYIPPLNLPPLVPLPNTEFPLFIPPALPLTADCSGGVYWLNQFPLTWSRNEIYGEDEILFARAFFPCRIRSGGGAGTPTYLLLNGVYLGDAEANTTVTATDEEGNEVLGSTYVGGGRYDFEPISELDVAGFKVTLEEGVGSIVSLGPGPLIQQGTFNADNSNPFRILPLTEGEYSIESKGGPWHPQQGGNTWAFQLGVGDDPGHGYGGDLGMHLDGVFRFTASFPGLTIRDVVRISENHARLYFSWLTTNGEVNIRAQDNDNTDPGFGFNTGTLGYIFRHAVMRGRGILLAGSSISNICKIT